MFTCPFCIRSYPKTQITYYCPDCGTEADPGIFALVNGRIKCKGPKLLNNNSNGSSVSNHKCGGYATLRKCPSCGSTIPDIALQTPNLPFSIVGVANSGKTNYITVMLHELANSDLGLALGHQTPETMQHQRENYNRIYNEHRVPEATAPGTQDPQIWFIMNNQKRFANMVPTYTFTIFDGAGEDHENLDPSSITCRYIKASKAIILTIDPLVLPNVRNSGTIDEKTIRNSLGGDEGAIRNEEEIINSVANYIKTARGIHPGKMLDIPVAVVLTKFDTLLNHPAFGPQALIKNSSLTVRDGKVDLSEILQVSEEIKNWLNQIGEKQFIRVLSSHFKNYCFFGVSSYGAPPIDSINLPKEIKPHRVLDPILWLFKLSNFID